MTFGQALLYPFSLLYGNIMAGRNWLYDKGYFKSTRFLVPVLNIGNLTVGGTGKTPHVEYLLHLLDGKKVSTLSRGYKRLTKGFLYADENASAATLGDESFQYYQDFPKIIVAVSENRATGIQTLLTLHPDLEAVILDDAFQHRGVSASLNILISDYYRLFLKDLVLPAGRLREHQGGASRADLVIISKCPDELCNQEKKSITEAIVKVAGKVLPVFFTRFNYGVPVAVSPAKTLVKDILLITAIANSKPLEEYLKNQGYILHQHYCFADHYSFTEKDIRKIYADWQRYSTDKEVVIFTTRKDATKLLHPVFASVWKQVPLFIIPVKVEFLENQSEFDSLVLNHIAAYNKPDFN